MILVSLNVRKTENSAGWTTYGTFLVAAVFIFYFCLAPATPGLLAQTIPPLPPLTVENFGPAIREQAQKAYNEARARPRDAEANGRLGMVLQTYEQYELAATLYERARYLAPAEFRWLYYWAIVQASLGKQAEATAALKEAVGRRPDYLPAQVTLADLLLAAGQMGESQRLYEAVLQKTPGSVFAHYGLGRIKAAGRDLAAAVEHFRRACELSPHYGAAHYALASAYRDLGQTAQASEHFALHQKDSLTRPLLDDPLLNAVAELNIGSAEILKKATSFDAEGQLEQAAVEYERALKINPKLANANVNLIIIYAKLEKAEKRYRLAVEINPNLAEAHYNFGVLLTKQARYEEAASAFQRSLEINPFYAESHHNYGVLLEREGRFAEATEHYRAAIANRPNFRMAHFNLGRMLIHQGETAEAVKHFLNTLTPEDEDTPRFMYALAAAYVRIGDREHAIQYARGARQRAIERKQTELLALIERDLRILEQDK